MGIHIGVGLWVGCGGIKDGIKDGMGWDYVLERDYGLVGVRLRMGWGGIMHWSGIMGLLGRDYALDGDYGLVGVGLRTGWGGIMGCLGWDYAAWSQRD